MITHSSAEQYCEPVAATSAALSRAQLSRILRTHIGSELYDESGSSAAGTAIYTLSDSADLLLVRYVGQTSAPRRRFQQHLRSARLWLPDELPWWVKSSRLRPLYSWIRQLHRDSGRLPTMIIHEWLQTPSQVRAAERARICDCLSQRLPLLNYEAEILARQLRLL